MVQIRYRTHDGRIGVFVAQPGQSLMAAAKAAAVPGIDADCGGSMVCGTCHVFVEEAWSPRLPAPSQVEADLLSYGLHPQANSRLSCQIFVTREMEDLGVEIPPSQR